MASVSSPSTAATSTCSTTTPSLPLLRILSLDGGGTRGVVERKVLERIFDTPELKGIKPCDFFDLIVGTSTGGIVAVLLGKLELTIAQALALYNEMTPIIFAPSILPRFPRYSTSNYEEQIKKVLTRHGLDGEHAPLFSDIRSKCDIALVATRGDDADGAKKLFRSYELPGGQSLSSSISSTSSKSSTSTSSSVSSTSSVHTDDKKVPIWKAVRATSAAPTFFRSMEIDDIHYIDGGVLANNPAMLAITEAKRRFPDRKIGALYSLGTGVSSAADLMVDNAFNLIGFVKDALSKLITSTKEDEAEAAERCKELGITYFRFDPPFVGDQPLDHPDMKLMLSYTAAYLDDPAQVAKLQESQKISAQFATGRVPPVTAIRA